MSKSYSPPGYAPPETRNLKYSPKCVFYVNGDKFFPGSKFCVSSRIRTLDGVKEELTKTLTKRNRQNGFIRNVFTPVGGSEIKSLDDFKDGEHYVASINDKFKPLPYREISEQRVPRRIKGFKKIDIERIYTPVTHAVEEKYRNKKGRSKSLSEQNRGLRLRVHINNENEKPVFPITIQSTCKSKMTGILNTIEDALRIPPIERVFKIQNQGYGGPADFTEIHEVEELNFEDHILVVPKRSGHVVKTVYLFGGKQDFKVTTSPRHGLQLFDSLVSNDKNHKPQKSLNRNKVIPSIGSSKQSDSRSPFSNAGSQAGRRNNQKSRTRQVDYDKDNGGVFRAKKQNNARGAQQVNDSRETRTEKPIDQMEAEIVEEEEINAKDKTTPIPPGTELNKQPSKETKQNADSQTKKSSQVKKDAKTDKRNNVSVLPPLMSDNKQTAESDKNKKSDKQDVNSVKDGHVKDAVKKIENDTDTKNVKVNAGNKPVDQKSGTDMEIEQIQGAVTPSGTKSNDSKVENNPGAVTPSGTKSNKTTVEKNQGAVTPSGTKSNKTEPNKSPIPASPQEGKISRASQTTKERMNEDDGMHQNDEFDDESFNRSGFDRNTPGGPSKDMRSSTPASRGESRPAPASRGESRQRQLQKENEAAAKIQAGARGYKARKEFNAKKESMQRDKDERNQHKQEDDMRRQEEEDERRRQADAQQSNQKKAVDEDLAASKIQASFKGYKTRKEMDVKKKQQVCDSNINDTSKNMSESDAAVKIQSGFKGYKVRKEYKHKKAQKQTESKKVKETDINDNEKKDKDKAENEAATKIQSNFRGYKTRKELSNNKKNDTGVDNSKMNEDDAAVRIQAGFKGYKTRKEFANKKSEKAEVKADNQTDKIKKQMNEDDAAVRIQAGFKGYKTRKEFTNKKSEKAEVKADNQTDGIEKQQEAATKIQSSFRGHKVRKEFGEKKKKQELLQQEEQAATRIQASFKGYNTRKQMASKKKEPQLPDQAPSPKQNDTADLDKAATKIQSGFRGYKTRKEFKSKVNAEPVVEADLDQLPDSAITRSMKKDQFIPGSKGAFASVIQSAYKVLHAKKTIEIGGDAFKFGWGVTEHDTETYDKLIANFKGFIARTRDAYEKDEYHKRSEAALKIQSGYRGYRVRQTKHYSIRAVNFLQASVRGYVTRKLNRVEVLEKSAIFEVANGDYYASVIQALCKGFLIRHSIKVSAQKDRSKIKSASSIQGPSVINDFESSGESENEISYWQDTNIKMYSDKTLRRAAAKIQSAYYSYQTRLKFKQLRKDTGIRADSDNEMNILESTSKIQSSFMGYILRKRAKQENKLMKGVIVGVNESESRKEADVCDQGDTLSARSSVKGTRKRALSGRSCSSRASGDGIKLTCVDDVPLKAIPSPLPKEKDNFDEASQSSVGEFNANRLSKDDTLRSSTRLSDQTNSLKSEMVLNISDIENEHRRGSALSTWKSSARTTKTSGGEIEKEGDSLREIEDDEGELSSMEKNVNAVGHLQAAFRAYKLRREISELMSGGGELIDIKQVDRAVSALRKDFSLRSAKVRRLGFGKEQEKIGGPGQHWWENDDENNDSLSGSEHDHSESKISGDIDEENCLINIPAERKENAEMAIKAAYRGFISRMTERIIKSASSNAKCVERSKSRTRSGSSMKRSSSSKSGRSVFHVQMHSDVINERCTRLQAAFAAYQTRRVFISLSKLVDESERTGHGIRDSKLERMGSLYETDDFKLRTKSIAKIQAAYDSHRIANDVRKGLGIDSFSKSGSTEVPLSPTVINPHKVLPPIQQKNLLIHGHSNRPKSGTPKSCLDIPIVPEEKSKTQPDLYKRYGQYSKGISNIEIYIQNKIAASVIQANAKGYLTRHMVAARKSETDSKPSGVKATPTADRKTPISSNRKRPLSSSSSKASSKSSGNKSCKDVKHKDDMTMTDMMRVRTASIKLEAERRKVIAEQIRLKEQAKAKEGTLAIKIRVEDQHSVNEKKDEDSVEHLSPIPSSRSLNGDANSELITQEKAAGQIQKVYRGYKTRKSLDQKQKLQQEYEMWKAKREEAAVTIQSVWRGYHVRKELKHSPEVPESVVDFSHLDDQLGGLVVINIGRSKSEIERANRRHENASMIQMIYRACEIRRKLALTFSKRRNERNRAASKIQAYYSGHLTRNKRRESASATRIQNHFKAYLSRDTMFEQQILQAEEECKAATLIQASYKSFRRRRLNEAERKVRKLNQAASELQFAVQCFIARREFRKKQNHIENVSACKIQASFRGYKVRSYIKQAKEENVSACKIQASFRGYKVRSYIKQAKEAVDIIFAGFKGYIARQELKAHLKTMGEQRVSATLLQATYKAHLVRRSNRQFKEKMVRQIKAATRIQCSFHGMNARRKCQTDQQLLQERQQLAALKIQSTYRGHLGRKEASEKKHVKEIHTVAVDTVEEMVNRMWDYVTRRSQSSERIQSTVKGYCTRRDKMIKLSDEEKLRSNYASVIQAGFRARRHRVETEMKRHMSSLKEKTNTVASVIQLAFRTARFKKEILNRQRYARASAVQAVFRAKEIRKSQEVKMHDELRYQSAVKIQALYRGYSVRKDIEKEMEMIASLEPPPTGLISARTNSGKLLTISVDELLMKNSRALIVFHKKATELQDAFRAYVTRKEMLERLERKALVTQRTPRRVLSVTKRLTKEEKAAILIQKTFRGYWNRNVYRNAMKQRKKVLNNAASSIQAVVKGYIVRSSENGKRLRMRDEAMNVTLRRKHEAADVIVCAFRSHQAREIKRDLRAEM